MEPEPQPIEPAPSDASSLTRQLAHLATAFQCVTDADDASTAIARAAMEATSATAARVWTLNEDGQYWHAACIGLRPNDDQPTGFEKQVVVSDQAHMNGAGTHTWLSAPVRLANGMVIGILSLVRADSPFDDDAAASAAAYAQLLANALDHAALYRQLLRRVDTN